MLNIAFRARGMRSSAPRSVAISTHAGVACQSCTEAIMIWGMSIETFTLVHVIISLIAIGSGLVVLLGMIAGKDLSALTALFLTTTVLTSVTGFGFPFVHVTPGIVIGVISLLLLAI